MQHDFVEELRGHVRALSEGSDPAEVADYLAEALDRLEEREDDTIAVVRCAQVGNHFVGEDGNYRVTAPSPQECLRLLADNLDRRNGKTAVSAAPSPDHDADALRDIATRLQALHDAMREAAKKEALHPSVRFICDTIALNLGAPTGGPGHG